MEILSDWFKAYHLSLNTDKSVGIIFGQKKIKLDVFTYDNVTLNMVNSTKFLGIWIDRDLSWKTHIIKLSNKINSNMNLLHLGKNLLNIHAKR